MFKGWSTTAIFIASTAIAIAIFIAIAVGLHTNVTNIMPYYLPNPNHRLYAYALFYALLKLPTLPL